MFPFVVKCLTNYTVFLYTFTKLFRQLFNDNFSRIFHKTFHIADAQYSLIRNVVVH